MFTCLCGKGFNQDVDLVEMELCQLCVQVFKIYGARKKGTEADKFQGYFFNKEIIGFSVNNCFITYKNTVLGNRDPSQFL